MPNPPPTLDRPQRWDATFDPGMLEANVERLLRTAPFSRMKPGSFPARLSLRDIVKHDTRVRAYRRGEMIVREGDYGTSAFLVLSGVVRVVLGQGLPASVLGRRLSFRKNIFKAVAQLWACQKAPESFSRRDLKKDPGVSAREARGKETGFFSRTFPASSTSTKPPFWKGGSSSAKLPPSAACPAPPPFLPGARKPGCWKFAGRACGT